MIQHWEDLFTPSRVERHCWEILWIRGLGSQPWWVYQEQVLNSASRVGHPWVSVQTWGWDGVEQPQGRGSGGLMATWIWVNSVQPKGPTAPSGPALLCAGASSPPALALVWVAGGEGKDLHQRVVGMEQPAQGSARGPELLKLEDGLDSALRHWVWFWEVLCGAGNWSWSLFGPFQLGIFCDSVISGRMEWLDGGYLYFPLWRARE